MLREDSMIFHPRILPSPRSTARRQGVALVITLGAVVLLTVLILAFFSQAQFNRQIAASGASQVKTDIFARSAMEIILGEIREEIRGGSDVLNGGTPLEPLIFQPKTAQDTGLRKTGAADEDSTGMTTIRKVSASGQPLNASLGGRLLGSAVSTAAESQNHRKWTTSKWYTGSGAPSLGAARLPDWVLVARDNGIVVDPPVQEAANPASPNYVIGRFAYVVYDAGGLLDANLAGHSSTLTASTAWKTSPAAASLDALGLSQETIDDFVAWRNRNASGGTVSEESFREWSTGLPRATGTPDAAALAAARSGHLAAPLGYGAILSRRDLLNHPQIGSAGKYFTHFSRAATGPTAAPDTITTSNPKLADVRFPATGTVPHYGDNGVSEPFAVSAGDPLLQRRFSLAKLAWLTAEGPSADLPTTHAQYHSGGTAQAIRSCFGLVWVPADGRWEYRGHAGSSVKTQIATLDQVASEMREPDFFELLRAGITEGSLGQETLTNNPLSGNSSPFDVQPTLESSKDLQVIKIGANIIDCADPDNYPTIVYFEPGGLGVESAGVENLPYLHGVDTILLSQIDTTAKQLREADLIWTPILFNPHGGNAAPAGGPLNVDVSILNGFVTSMQVLGSAGSALPGLSTSLAGQTFSVPASGFGSRPDANRSAGHAQALKTLVPYATNPAEDDICTFRIFSYRANSPGTLPTAYTATSFNGRTNLANLHLALQYTTPGGKKKTYMTLGSYEDGSGVFPDMGTTQVDCNTGHQTQINTPYQLLLFDPRSKRLGPAQAWGWGNSASPSSPLLNLLMRYRTPFAWPTADASTGLSWAIWPEGDKDPDRTTAIPNPPRKTGLNGYWNMADPDGITRPADAWLGQVANPLRDTTDMARRPVVLQRPFQTVAELGYVSRDNPWKSLNFFDETSGDKTLLDLFDISDAPAMAAGRTNPNAASPEVLTAIFKGAGKNADGSMPLTAPDDLAAAYSSFVRNADGSFRASAPLHGGEFADFLMSLNGNADVELDVIKNRREAVVRALRGASQTRTWNLLIDVVAETGKFPLAAVANPGQYDLSKFVVEGSKRFWLSVAIDRYTGKVIDRQVEPVTE